MPAAEAETSYRRFETTAGSNQGLHEYAAMANLYDPLSLQWAGFDHEDEWVRYIVQGRVLDLGSGIQERFAGEIGLLSSALEVSEPSSVYSVNPDYSGPGEFGAELRKIQSSGGLGENGLSAAAWGDALPYRDNSFRGVFAISSVGTYVDPLTYPEEARNWLGEIWRVLEPGGYGFVGPANLTPFKEAQSPQDMMTAYKTLLSDLDVGEEFYRYSYVRSKTKVAGGVLGLAMLSDPAGGEWRDVAWQLSLKKPK